MKHFTLTQEIIIRTNSCCRQMLVCLKHTAGCLLHRHGVNRNVLIRTIQT